ncbi:IclR family transcriptional regulator [Gephyromycinifex aptenodytis]|uniref:IclR family transcriptional regulator n=1 Tax=Gephyromycinifex aptenodytis TaxID=2716227 RepID=UPI001B2FE60C|nr:helix-turn-helix domain-containing protein [Gephyromycinifex aptenodytis]
MPTTTRSQTLDRGIRLLEILAAAPRPMTMSELVQESGLHRSIVYRLIRTLEDHRLVARSAAETYRLGFGLAALAGGLTQDLTSAARRPLQELADATDLAAFIVVREAEEAVTVLVVEPSIPGPMFTLRIGYRHAVTQGAPGRALLMLDGDGQVDADQRQRGWTHSLGEVLDGVGSVAAPLRGYVHPAAVALTYVGDHDVEHLSRHVLGARDRIAAAL